MDGYNWNYELINIFEKSDDCWFLFQRNTVHLWPLQVASWNNDGTTQMYGSKFSCEITMRLK